MKQPGRCFTATTQFAKTYSDSNLDDYTDSYSHVTTVIATIDFELVVA